MAIKFIDVSYIYSAGLPFASKALDNINLEIKLGAITAIIGETGSGKSTLIQHLNALLLPTFGEIDIFDYKLINKTKIKGLKKLRAKVGLVFQFSEYQLFEETVIKDVAFGPKNFGCSESESYERAKKALAKVGIDENLFNRSPLDLSGGQKRRVAIAGILAIEPEVIVLDEPTAGLDPQGGRDIIKLFYELNKNEKTTIILVSHDNELVYNFADNVILLDKGHLIYSGLTKPLFEEKTLRNKYHILAPAFINFKEALSEEGFTNLKATNLKDLVKEISERIRK